MGIPDPSLLAGSPTMAGPASMAAQPVAEQEVEAEMGPVVTIMKPILRFLQLLCENHNHDLQVSGLLTNQLTNHNHDLQVSGATN